MVSGALLRSSNSHIGFSHWEQDEDGALNQFLAAADTAEPLCGAVNALINADGMDRPPRVHRDGEPLQISDKPEEFVKCIDQLAELGLEVIILNQINRKQEQYVLET
jgi:hypothetical protein